MPALQEDSLQHRSNAFQNLGYFEPSSLDLLAKRKSVVSRNRVVSALASPSAVGAMILCSHQAVKLQTSRRNPGGACIALFAEAIPCFTICINANTSLYARYPDGGKL